MNQSNERTEGKQKLQDLLAWLMDKKMYIVVVLLAAGGFYYANRQRLLTILLFCPAARA